MSKINAIIVKAISDESFRIKFLNDPCSISSEFDLNEEEIAQLKNIDTTELVQLNYELEERLSKSFVELTELNDSGNETHISLFPSHSSILPGPIDHNSVKHVNW